MRDLLIITPTRGRLASAIRLADAVKQTCELDTQLVFGVDEDDPAWDKTGTLAASLGFWACIGPRDSYSGWTNKLAGMFGSDFRYLASLSDDHLPETKGWDRLLIEANDMAGGTGIVYGNDMIQGVNLPTAWLVSSDIVRALGWMTLPQLDHMFCDNVTLDIAANAGCLAYMNEVIIRHLHYTAGLSQVDQTARDGMATWAHDEAAYHAWKRDGMAADVAKVKALLPV